MSEADRSPLDDVLAEAMERWLAGEAAEAEAILAAHPEHADVLRARLRDLGQMWAGPATAGTLAAQPKPRAELVGGTRLGEFVVERELGRGGMGVVYVAVQESLKRRVALKVIPQAAALSPLTRQRFVREAEAMASLAHPNLVPVFAAGESAGMLYIAMELVDGVSLTHVLEAMRGHRQARPGAVWRAVVGGDASALPAEGRAPNDGSPRVGGLDRAYVEACCRMAEGVARGLHYAHERGVVHRDVKPGNILLSREGQPRLLDFGLASISTQPHVTVSGQFFGTPYYVSPEQAQGKLAEIGPRSDVYSLGATLYECLTLSPPFDAPSTSEVLTQVVHAQARPPRRVDRSVPRDLSTIVMTALEKAPADRYDSADAFAADVHRFLAREPIRARPPGLPRLVAKAIRRKPVHAGLVAAVCVAVAAAVVGLSTLGAQRRTRRKVVEATDAATRAQAQLRAQEQYELGRATLPGFMLSGRRVNWKGATGAGKLLAAETKRRAKAAEKHFVAAAEHGHRDAMTMLARLYLSGAFGEVDPSRAAQWAERALDPSDPASALLRGRCLARIPERREEGVRALAALARHPHVPTAAGAVSALGRAGGQAALDALAGVLREGNVFTRSCAASALGELGDRRAVKVLAARLDSDRASRAQILTALARLGGDEALEHLLAAARHAESDVRAEAAAALGLLNDERARPALTKALADEAEEVRRAATRALATLGRRP